jgi:tetratricopeptide (TPR) repeat protein
MQLPWSRFPELGDVRPPRPPRAWPRHLRYWLAAGVVLLTLLVGIAVWLAPKFERNLTERSVRQAQELLQQQDYRRALLVLQQAVQANPGDFEARRELARFYGEAGDSARALTLWRELVQVEPRNDADRLELAMWALRLNDLATAREALDGLQASARVGAEYHRVAAGVALRTGDHAGVARELAELAILEPDNPRTQFNHAAVQLVSGDRVQVTEAWKELEKLAQGGPLRIRATLQLIRSVPVADLPGLAAQLLPRPSRLAAVFSWGATPRGLLDLVRYMEEQPDPEPEDAALLADWMRRQGMVPEAAFWLTTLSPATQRNRAIQIVRAACYVQLRDWRGLETTLRQGVWGRASDDALDLAFAAHLQREAGHADHARLTWGDALDAAGNSVESLHVLLRLAAEVGWSDGTDDALRRLVRVNPHEPGGWQSLAAIAVAQGASEKLFQVYASWLKAEPASLDAQGGLVWEGAVIHHAWPMDNASVGPLQATAAWTAARALALHSAGQDDEALERLAKLPPEVQQDRRVDLVRGIAQAELGRRAESAASLAAAAAGPLLPEESALLQAAKARIQAQ